MTERCHKAGARRIASEDHAHEDIQQCGDGRGVNEFEAERLLAGTKLRPYQGL